MDLAIMAFWTVVATANIAGAAIAFADKQKAKQKKWRTPEKTFFWLAALGGGPGVLVAFIAFRHKTRHGWLIAGVAGLTVLFYAAVIAARFLLSSY
jgi:uncharacterized membrane protein YsdA (DUF1294 family)